MARARALLAALGLLVALVLGVAPTTTSADADPPPTGFTVAGVDLHDGMVAHFGSSYYLYGTEYGCGYSWYTAGTSWCGFGVSTAPSLAGPWTTPTLLFQPTDPDPYETGHTYDWTCGQDTGQGCFNPRMIQRTGWGPNDGVFILWFNAPLYYSQGASSAYMAMGCAGPAGPCGATEGGPHGSTHRPTVHQCSGANGDFGLAVQPAARPVLFCTAASAASLSEEELDYNGTNGDGTGATALAGLSSIEGPGAYQDPATGTWVLTYSDTSCGYCAGTGTGYATASSLAGPWSAPANVGFSAPVTGRRDLSATSCGGQPRTVSVVDGQAWQGIDLWTGTRNETNAGLRFEPLTYTGPPTAAPGDGTVWRPPFQPYTC